MIGIGHAPRRMEQPLRFLLRNLREQPAIGVDRFEEFRGGTDALLEGFVDGVGGFGAGHRAGAV